MTMDPQLREAFVNVPVPEPGPGFEVGVSARIGAPLSRQRYRTAMTAYWLVAAVITSLTCARAVPASGVALAMAVVSTAVVLGSGAIAAGGVRGLARLLAHTMR